MYKIYRLFHHLKILYSIFYKKPRRNSMYFYIGGYCKKGCGVLKLYWISACFCKKSQIELGFSTVIFFILPVNAKKINPSERR